MIFARRPERGLDPQGALLEKEVTELVAWYQGAEAESLNLKSDLWADLGMAGDDVDEFFLDFAQHYAVPVGEIDLTGCFPGESGCLLWPLSLHGPDFQPTRRVRIRDLVVAAQEHRWPTLETTGHDGHSADAQLGLWKSRMEHLVIFSAGVVAIALVGAALILAVLWYVFGFGTART